MDPRDQQADERSPRGHGRQGRQDLPHVRKGALRPLEALITPRSPTRLPSRSRGLTRVDGAGVVHRLHHVDGTPVLLRAWMRSEGDVVIRADGVAALSERGGRAEASREHLERAIEKMRFALGVDDDLSDFHARFKSDPLLGPVIRRRPWARPGRTFTEWAALLGAITAQLIEASRAAQIERRIVQRWGTLWRREEGDDLWDTPGAEIIAGVAPASIVAHDLTEARSLAMIRCAREVAAGRVDLADDATDARLLKIREIGPWTLQCLGLSGRGDWDSLPAGDLGYVKLVPHLTGLGRRATVEEVEEFYAPYEPYRGLAGHLSLVGYHKLVAQGPPLPYVHSEYEAGLR